MPILLRIFPLCVVFVHVQFCTIFTNTHPYTCVLQLESKNREKSQPPPPSLPLAHLPRSYSIFLRRYVCKEHPALQPTDRTDDSCSSTRVLLTPRAGGSFHRPSQDTLRVLLPLKTARCHRDQLGSVLQEEYLHGLRDMRVEAPFMNDDVQPGGWLGTVCGAHCWHRCQWHSKGGTWLVGSTHEHSCITIINGRHRRQVYSQDEAYRFRPSVSLALGPVGKDCMVETAGTSATQT